MVKKIIIACTLVCMTTMVSSVSLAKTIDKGQRGHHVSKVQTMLKHQGFLHDSVDGIYGHNTEQAVRKFQKVEGTRCRWASWSCNNECFRKDGDSIWWSWYSIKS